MDLNDNGNFGLGLGLNVGVPIAPELGIGFQAGSRVILSDFGGTLFTDSTMRTQDFTSVGFFQRIPHEEGSLNWGFTYDFLFDDYYDNLRFGQWRVKLGWEMNCWNEVGIWAAIREHGQTAILNLNSTITEITSRCVTQGNLYWRHTWLNDASVTGRIGLAESPNLLVLGADGRVPISPHMAIIGGFTYMPSTNPGFPNGQAQEVWNVSVGLEFVPHIFCHGLAGRFTPVLPVADNGSMAVQETSITQP